MVELWEKQIRAIAEKEAAKGSFSSCENDPQPYLTDIERIGRNTKLMRTHYHRKSELGYEEGRMKAPEIGCPLYLDTNYSEARLGLIGFYVGGADEILEKHDEFLEHAVAIYQNIGVIDTNHVQRKLMKYGNESPENRNKLLQALRNRAIL